ncbi:MAG: PQQ-binding-like beta-propeller repeat protein, partial [Gemmatales bacterium]|nr:PQQ-binding-like beta-propeller repeat protein [Gemmatales bacterium]
WSPKHNIAWKAELPGLGQSSPVIWNDKVFVTSISGPMKDTCHVTALAIKDGQRLWDRTFPSTQKSRVHYYQSCAAPSPCVDSECVYAFFETGELVAIRHNGEVVWTRSLVKDYGSFENDHGLASSLTQTPNAIFVLIDHDGPSYLLAVDKKTGKTLWKTDRASRRSWASPVLMRIGQCDQVVVSSHGSVQGYDAETGKLLWSYDEVGGNVTGIAYPVANGSFLVYASPGRQDQNLEQARRSNFLMTVEVGPDNTYKPRVQWYASALPTFANAMVHQGIAYWVNRVGVITAYDVRTGKELFSERTKESCWATPLGVDNRVYFFGKDGTTTVIRAGPRFEVLAVNRLWDDELSENKAEVPPRPAERSTPPEPAPEKLTPPQADAPRHQPTDKTLPLQKTPDKPGPRKGPKGELFPDPVQYAVAAVNGSLIIRTGKVVYCVRELDSAKPQK